MYSPREFYRSWLGIRRIPDIKEWRAKTIHRHLRKDGLGLEIGPSHRPLAPKRAGYDVRIMDYLSKEDLVEKYTALGIDSSEIEEVDFVWSGQTYAELVGGTGKFDWIIASHAIEHMPDFIGFLDDCRDILKVGGVLSLAVPDKRFIFDAERDCSTLASIVDAHTRRDKYPSAGAVAEFLLLSVTKEKAITWDPFSKRQFAPSEYRFSTEEVMKQYRKVAENGEFVDTHVWVFTPASFVRVFSQLRRLGFLADFEIIEEPASREYEFMIALRRIS